MKNNGVEFYTAWLQDKKGDDYAYIRDCCESTVYKSVNEHHKAALIKVITY